MSILLTPDAIVAAPPRPEPTPPRPPAAERMLTDQELRAELDSFVPAYKLAMLDGLYYVVQTDMAVESTQYGAWESRVFGTGRLKPRALSLPVVSDANLRLKVVAKAILSDPRRFEMASWTGCNECGTTHCIAGWARELGGGPVTDFAHQFGDEMLGLALLGHEATPHFYDTNELALKYLQSVDP